MRKEIYLIRGNEIEDHRQFSHRILQTAYTTAELINPEALKVTLTMEPPPKISVIPFRKSKIAVFSVLKEDNNQNQRFLRC